MKNHYNWIYDDQDKDQVALAIRITKAIKCREVSILKMTDDKDIFLCFFWSEEMPESSYEEIIYSINAIIDNIKTGENRTLTEHHVQVLKSLFPKQPNCRGFFKKQKTVREPLLAEREEKPCCLIM